MRSATLGSLFSLVIGCGGGDGGTADDTSTTGASTSDATDGSESEAPSGDSSSSSEGALAPAGCDDLQDALLPGVHEDPGGSSFCDGVPAGTQFFDGEEYSICTGDSDVAWLYNGDATGTPQSRHIGFFTYGTHYAAIYLEVRDWIWQAGCASSEWPGSFDLESIMTEDLAVGASLCAYTPFRVSSVEFPGAVTLRMSSGEQCTVMLHPAQ
jgi:hypothetical protein